MSLFNKDFNNRSGLKCDVVYTDLINDIPTGNIATKDWVTTQNYLTSSSSVKDTSLSGNVVLINSTQTLTNKTLYEPKISNGFFSKSIYLPFETGIQKPNSSGYIYWGSQSYPNSFMVDDGYNFNIASGSNVLINIGDFMVGTTNVVKFHLINTWIYNKLNVTGDSAIFLNPPIMNGSLIQSGSIQDTSLSGNVVLLNTAQTLTNKTLTNPSIDNIFLPQGAGVGNINWGNNINPSSQIYDDGDLNLNTDDNMWLNIGTNLGFTNVMKLQLTDTYIYNRLSLTGPPAVFYNTPLLNGGGIDAGSILDTSLSSNINLLNSNQTVTGTKTYTTTPIIINQYLNGSSALRTGTAITLTTPYFELYPLAPMANMTITIPTASASLNGVRFKFRRVGGTITTTINSASANIYPINSFTPTNVLIASNLNNVSIFCCFLTTTTYGWFIA